MRVSGARTLVAATKRREITSFRGWVVTVIERQDRFAKGSTLSHWVRLRTLRGAIALWGASARTEHRLRGAGYEPFEREREREAYSWLRLRR